MEDGKVIIKTELETKSFEEQIKQTEDKLNRLVNAYEKASNMTGKIRPNEEAMKNLRLQIEKTANSLKSLRDKQAKLDAPPTGKILEYMKNIGKETQRTIRKVSTLVLGIFGIRGAYMAVRNAMSVISSQDQQLATDIEYMKNALAYVLEPVVRKIVDLMKTLMFYVGYIAKAWFGKDIFANANKSLKNATGSAKSLNKELNKTLAGFDEMNVLQDTSSSGGGEGGGATLPSFDLTQGMQDEVPEWLKWIGEHGEEIISIIAGIAAGLTALHFGFTALQSLGIGVAVAGLVYAIQGLLDYLKDPTWENFGKIIQGIGVFVIGLGIAFASLPVIITGVVVLIVGTIVKYWDKIKEFLQKGIDWLTSKSDWIRDHFGDQIGKIYDNFVFGLKMILIGFDNVFKGIRKIFDGIIQFVTGVFTGNWSKAWEGVKKIFSGIFQALFGVAQVVLGKIIAIAGSIAMAVGQTISDVFKGVVNAVLWAIESILNAPIRTVNKLISVINKIPGISLGKLPTFNLPRLAKGGIINMPGSGVMVGSAIAGERGAEGVIPLTDSQQMALLGEAIGKYITINANITNTMNGRVISRELQRVQNDSDFAYNR